MANIGSFKKSGDELHGNITTLTFQVIRASRHRSTRTSSATRTGKALLSPGPETAETAAADRHHCPARQRAGISMKGARTPAFRNIRDARLLWRLTPYAYMA